MVDNIKIAEQLKKLQEDMNALVEAQTRQLRAQAGVVQQIVQAYGQLNPSDAVQNIEATKNALDQAASSAQKTGESVGMMQRMTDAIKEAANAQQQLGSQSDKTIKVMGGFGALVGMWDGFATGIMGTWNAMKLLTGVTTTTFEALGQLALSVISFPFKILQNLIDFASQGGGDNSLRQALEDIRKEFGDLRKSSSAAIISMSRQMRGELANTGLSVWRIFGNLAERLKTIAEYAKNIGPLFAVLAGQFMKNSEAVGAYFKGLGLTEEGQRAVSSRAFALGEDITEVTRQLANYSVQLADQFGISAKEVSRDVGNMMNDFENFGGMAPQVLTQISVYARRLGVEVKGLLGVIGQFDNFEGAARSAAQLTQAFGLQLDALELLKAQDPAERTEMLRKSFFAAGRSIENMTRQERALLQQQTGLEASTLDLVFSAKNQGLSYDQVKKKSEGARKSQLTQAEAMQKLAGAIERLVKSGDFGRGGFFERFFQGFERGIVRSRDFRKLMIDIRGALRATYWAGAQVGRMFVDLFPGVQELLQGLDGLFEPRRFRRMLQELKDNFRNFFKSLTGSNGAESVKTFIENLKRMFLNYFNGSSEQGRRILNGARDFLKTFGQIAGGVLRMALDGVTKGIRFVVDLLKGGNLGSLGIRTDGFMGFIMEVFEPLADAIVEAWPMLKQALVDLFDQVWPRVRDFLVSNSGIIVGVLFGPAVLRGLIGGIAGSLAGVFTKGIVDGVSKSLASSAVQQAVARVPAVAQQASQSAQAIKGGTEAVSATGGMAKAAQAAPVSPASIGRMAMIALIITVGVIAIVAAIAALAEYIKYRQLTMTQMFTAAGVMGAAGLVMIEIAAAVALVGYAGTMIQGNMGGALIGLAAVGLVGAMMVEGIIQIVEAFREIDPSRLNTAMTAMIAGGAFIAAASGVLIAATAIGALFMATYGLGAAAAVVGLAAIASTTELMVEQVKNVINEVGRLQISGGFDRKFDIFTQVLEAITSFGSMVADIMTSTQSSSLWGWVTGGNSRNQIRVLEELRTTLTDMTGQMKSLVQDLLREVTQLDAAPEQLQKAELFGRIMSTLGELVKNFRPPESLFQAEGLFTSGIDERLRALGTFITRMTGALNGVIRTVVAQFSEIAKGANFDEQARQNFEAIGSMLEVIGTLSRSLLIVINQQYSGLTGAELQERIPQVTDVIVSMMRTLFASGGGGMIEAMSGLITAMVGSLSGLSERDARRLNSLAPVLTKAFEAIAQIGLTVSNLGALVENTPAEQRTAALGTLKAIVGTMLYGIRDVISGLVEATRDMFVGLSASQVNSLKSGVETVRGMIEAISQLPGTLTSLVEALGDGGFNYQRIRARLGTIVSLFYNQDDSGNPGLPVLFREAANAFNSIPELAGNPSQKLQQLSQGLSSISEISGLRLDEVARSIEAQTESLKSAAFTHMAENIRAMVAEVNSIATDLGSIQPININTQLKALGGRLGLGNSEELTIRNRDFNITVQLDVHIDSQELERTLVDRPNSRILSRPGRGR